VEVTAIMTAVNVASTYLGFRWIDKFGGASCPWAVTPG